MLTPNLPFARGTCASGAPSNGVLIDNYGATVTLASTYRLDLKGVTKTVMDTKHGTNKEVTLLAVQNVGSDITLGTDAVAGVSDTLHLGRAFDSGAGDVGWQLSGSAAGAGAIGVLLDDYLPSGFVIKQYDWVWAVIKGPVYGVVGTGTATSATVLAFDAAGKLIDAATTDFQVAVSRDSTSAVAGTRIVVDVLGNGLVKMNI